MRRGRSVERPPRRRSPRSSQAVSDHADGYVRYRALVLMTGFNDPRTKDSMREVLASPNDRLRAVAYSFFERNPDPSMLPPLLAALDKEVGEFVRPGPRSRARRATALTTRARQALLREVGRGEDFFRSAVIEALGDHKATYAFDALTAVAKLDGPLQDDAALALGKVGDKRAIETLGAIQRTASRQTQPAIAAAICLLGINCESHENFLSESLKFAEKTTGFQELLRAAASGLAALGVAGRKEAAQRLFTVGIPSSDPTRAPSRSRWRRSRCGRRRSWSRRSKQHPDRENAIALLAEGFDMLEEDLDKERFFALARRTYWESANASPRRVLMQTLIGKLDF